MNILKRIFGASKPVASASQSKLSQDEAWQIALAQEISIAMLRQIPEDWTSAQLVLEPTENGLGTGMRHSAITPQGADGFRLKDAQFATPNMEVMAATRKLELAWVKRGSTFKRVTITAVSDGDDWQIKSECEYD